MFGLYILPTNFYFLKLFNLVSIRFRNISNLHPSGSLGQNATEPPRARAPRPARVRGNAGVRPSRMHSSTEPQAKYINMHGKNNLGGRVIVKAIFENNDLKLLDKLDLLEGEEVEIELKKKIIFGLLKGWKIDTQSLKDELRKIDG